MTHDTAFRRALPTRPKIRDPRPGCRGTLHAVGRFWGPPLDVFPGVRVLYQCGRCGSLIGLAGDDRVCFIRRVRPAGCPPCPAPAARS